MEYQKKLYDRRTIAADHSRAWTHVVLGPNFHPAQWKHSLDSDLTSVTCVKRNIVGRDAGGSGHQDVLRLRASDEVELRKDIEKLFPGAVFSTSSPELSLKEQHALEVKQAKAEADAKAAAQAEEDRIVAASKEIAAQMSPEQIAQYRADTLNMFMNNATWHKWFRDNAAPDGTGFLNFPNSTGRNREVVLRYCEQRGFRIPNHQVLDEGMRYMLNNKHFYLQNTFKRSETDAFNSVVPFEQIQAEARRVYFSDSEIAAATKRLSQVLPVGQKVNLEYAKRKAREIGISDALFRDIAAGQAQSSAVPDVSAMSEKELKKALAATRKPVNPLDRMKGY